MVEVDRRLVGMWEKSGEVACADQYAANIRFEENGLYFGTTEPPGAFTWWDGGTWQVAVAGQLALSIANDAVVNYRYVLDRDALAITDPAGCTVHYRRKI